MTARPAVQGKTPIPFETPNMSRETETTSANQLWFHLLFLMPSYHRTVNKTWHL